MTPSASGAANARLTSFFDGRGSKPRGGTVRCVHVLRSITAPLHSAHKWLPPPGPLGDRSDTPRFCIKLDPQHPAFDHHRNLPTPIFCGRSKNCGAVHLSVPIFMPRPFASQASNDSCHSPATARSRSSATRAASV